MVNWFALNYFILVCKLFNWEIIIQLISNNSYRDPIKYVTLWIHQSQLF